MAVNAWLRPGDSSSSNNIYNFLTETFRIINPDRIGLVRADSGFWGDKFFNFLEGKHLNYITSVKINALLKQEIFNIRHWLTVDNGIQIAEINYRAKSWKKSRRIIVVRQSVVIRPKAMGKTLFNNLPD